MITVVDYKLNNLRSIENTLRRLGHDVRVTSDPADVHLLFTESEEFGLHRGLDLLKGRVIKLPSHLRVPHMGWNQLHPKRVNGLTKGVPASSYVYFVHSYYVEPQSPEIILATTDYEIEFPAIVHSSNVWATQFHPEKSQRVGERLLDNFARL